MKRFLLASSAALALLFAPDDAAANGRFPESNAIVFSKEDPDLVLVRVTFGLLVSHDRGATFDWVCEPSIGYTSVEDPMYAVTPSGRYLASLFQGLSLSTDKACTWAIAGTPQPYIDLAANPNDAKNIVALSTVYKGQDDAGVVRFRTVVTETKDEGSTFADVGPVLDDSILGETIDLTVSDPNRIYVSAIRYRGTDPVGLLFTSKDHGKTWAEQEVVLKDGEASVFIAAVDRDDPEKVYLRTKNRPDKPGRLILREKNPAGEDGVFRTLFTSKAPLEGFALSPDGKKVYVGSPFDGIWVASTTDYQFVQKSGIEVKCLAFNEEGLWACSNEKIGFVAGLSKDEGTTFTSKVNFCTIRGPLACASGTSTENFCPALWNQQRATLGCGGDPNPGTPDGGDLPFVEAGGSFRPDAPPGSSSSGSCDCQSVLPSGGWSSAGGTLACAIGAAAALLRRRRRR